MERGTVIITALVLIGAPLAPATADGADDNATWGLCQADENNEQGDNSSNGTIEETSPFENTTEDDCENASAPWEGTPGEDNRSNDTPGPDDHPDDENNPGDDHRNDSDTPDESDNPGDDEQPDDPGNGNESENPDEDDNPGDDNGNGDGRP